MLYDNRHRIFLQAVMQSGVVLDDDALALGVKIFDERINVATIAVAINEKLFPLHMSMKSGICEMTGNKYWSVVGTTYEEDIMIPSEFTQAQKAFLRLIYSEIIAADDGCISSTDCLNLANGLDTKLTMTDANHFIKTLIRKKWLYCKDGYIYMGIRSIVELMPYFRATYQDNFHNCYLCKEVIFHGQNCENCKKLYHNYCLVRYTTRQNDTKCPGCKHVMDISNIPDEVHVSQNLSEENTEEAMDVSVHIDISQPINTSKRTKKRSRAH